MSRNLWQTLTLRKTSVQGSSWQRGEEWGWPINDDVPFAMATDLSQREPSPPPRPRQLQTQHMEVQGHCPNPVTIRHVVVPPRGQQEQLPSGRGLGPCFSPSAFLCCWNFLYHVSLSTKTHV